MVNKFISKLFYFLNINANSENSFSKNQLECWILNHIGQLEKKNLEKKNLLKILQALARSWKDFWKDFLEEIFNKIFSREILKKIREILKKIIRVKGLRPWLKYLAYILKKYNINFNNFLILSEFILNYIDEILPFLDSISVYDYFKKKYGVNFARKKIAIRLFGSPFSIVIYFLMFLRMSNIMSTETFSSSIDEITSFVTLLLNRNITVVHSLKLKEILDYLQFTNQEDIIVKNFLDTLFNYSFLIILGHLGFFMMKRKINRDIFEAFLYRISLAEYEEIKKFIKENDNSRTIKYYLRKIAHFIDNLISMILNISSLVIFISACRLIEFNKIDLFKYFSTLHHFKEYYSQEMWFIVQILLSVFALFFLLKYIKKMFEDLRKFVIFIKLMVKKSGLINKKNLDKDKE